MSCQDPFVSIKTSDQVSSACSSALPFPLSSTSVVFNPGLAIAFFRFVRRSWVCPFKWLRLDWPLEGHAQLAVPDH